MTLPTWSNLVKQLPAHAKHIWLGGGLLLLVLLIGVRVAQDPMAVSKSYGELVAQSLAQLCVGPLVKQDRIELGLLSNRMASLPGVTGITLLGVDNQVLSVTRPNPRGRKHSAPITLDDAVIGYVQVAVNPHAVAAVPRWPWLLALALLLALPWLLGGVEWALAAVYARWQAASQPGSGGAAVAIAHKPARRRDDYVLVASLLNQLGLSAAEQESLLSTTVAAATNLAQLYQGQVEVLPGKGLAIWFANRGEDRGFEVACGGLLLSRFLQAHSDQGKFQLGLHQLSASEDAATERAAALADATLLAAAAAAGQLVLSDVAAQSILRQERLKLESLSHPLGADFANAGEHCFRLNAMADGYASLIDSQLKHLLDQEASTASESTF